MTDRFETLLFVLLLITLIGASLSFFAYRLGCRLWKEHGVSALDRMTTPLLLVASTSVLASIWPILAFDPRFGVRDVIVYGVADFLPVGGFFALTLVYGGGAKKTRMQKAAAVMCALGSVALASYFEFSTPP